MAVTLKVDKGAVARMGKLLKQVQVAAVRAYRNAGDKAQRALVTGAVKAIQARRNLKSTYIRSWILALRPGKGAGFEGLVWRVKVIGKAIPLAQYPHDSGTSKGIRVRVTPGKAAVLKHGFIGYGDTAILMRTSKKRGPLKQLYSGRITSALVEGVVARLQSQAATNLRVAFATGLEAQLAKLL